ncbi:MAG: hypothetical protein ACKO6L_04835 [Flavobacteriales bacterium]
MKRAHYIFILFLSVVLLQSCATGRSGKKGCNTCPSWDHRTGIEGSSDAQQHAAGNRP